MYRFRVLMMMAVALGAGGLVRGQVAKIAQIAIFLAQKAADKRSDEDRLYAKGESAIDARPLGPRRWRLSEEPPPRRAARRWRALLEGLRAEQDGPARGSSDDHRPTAARPTPAAAGWTTPKRSSSRCTRLRARRSTRMPSPTKI